MRVYLFDLFIGVMFGGMIVAGTCFYNFLSRPPMTRVELIFMIIFAAMCVVANHGVENDEYDEDD